MRKLILHVGMHKTGTTSIQRSLNGLSESGVRYVELGSSNHTVPVSAAFADEGQQGNRIRMGRTAEQMGVIKKRTLERLHAELSLKEFHTFVISGEGIVNLPLKSVRDLRTMLMKYVERIHVFAYVREPVGYSSSAFQERTKGGYDGYDLTQPNYRLKFAPFIKVFGRDNVSLKEFSKTSLRNGSVVADFCEVWSIPFNPKREIRSNESLSEPVLKLLHLFNRSETKSSGTLELRKVRMRMVEDLNGHFKGRFQLPAQFHGAAVNREDIDWLDTNFKIRFEVDPSIGRAAPVAEFARFLDQIEPAVVDSYRELLAGLGIDTNQGDSAAELLEKHFKQCLERGDAQGEERVAVAQEQPVRLSLGRRLHGYITALRR